VEAARKNDFCCELKDGILKQHSYYYQVQGQMAIASRNFVIYFNKKVSVERILFDENQWIQMLPTLKDFYINGLVPILVKRLHE